jgi:uncharacterized protein YlxP (DUF503 family)
MATIGVITLEMRLPHVHSLKEKRQIIKSLKDRLRGRHNVAVAEIDFQDLWQRGLLSIVTVSSSRGVAERTLQTVEKEAAVALGPCLVETTVEWVG